MKQIITVMMAMLLSVSAAHADKTQWPKKVAIDEQSLNYVGDGVRKKFMMPLYDIALYTLDGTVQDEIVSSDEHKAIRIIVTSKLLSMALFTEAVLDGYKKYENYPEVKDVVRDYLADFDMELVEGDVYTVYHDPERGLVTYHNEEVLNVIDNSNFSEGMFNIWLGERPVNRRLKSDLLGK